MTNIIEGNFVEAAEFNVRALNMKMEDWEGSVGLHFQEGLVSAADNRLGIRRPRQRDMETGRETEEEIEDGPFGYYAHDIIIRNLNEHLWGQVIGGITIMEDTPVSVIIRALNYEYADLFQLVTGSFPQPHERYIPEYSLPVRLRCLSVDCSGSKDWDQGF
jgi:hypothetical protein